MLRWLGSENERRSIAIMSPDRGEGRTYVAANLGLVFAQVNQRTLLIDGDLRNPKLHVLFGLDNATGLSTSLTDHGEADVQHIAGLTELAVLPSGPIPPNPQELLSRTVFSELIHSLQKRYEVVIVDTSPAETSADAYMVAARTGAGLIVARRGITRVAHLNLLTERIGMTRAAILGTVLNEG